MKLTRNFKISLVILFCFLSVGRSNPSILSTVDYITSPTQLYWSQSNTVGISYDLPEFLPWATSSILLSRIRLAAFDGWMGNMFYQSFHVPRGYKYNCSSTIYGGTVTCTKDLILNTSETSSFTKFVANVSNYGSTDIGLDIQRRNFSRSTYFNNMKAFFNLFGSTAVNPELLDYGDKASSIYNTTFTVSDYLNDLAVLSAKFYSPTINGPGITEDADSTWVGALDTINQNYYSVFTFRCIVFKNVQDVTIPNLLSENYGEQYLRRRLVDSQGDLIDMIEIYYVGINDIRLVDGNGVDGVTNTFAAAIWALDIAISLASIGGSFINFHNSFSSSNYQSVFGPGPGFQAQPIFYGILFASLALKDQPVIYSAPMTAGSSSNIKSFGFYDTYQGGYRVLLMNKDTNASASGIMRVKMKNQGTLRCIYLTAPSLESKVNITIAGMYFVANASDYQGLFEFRDYQLSSGEEYFNIYLNYSQAALCEEIISTSLPTLIKKRRSPNFTQFLHTFFVISLLYFLL